MAWLDTSGFMVWEWMGSIRFILAMLGSWLLVVDLLHCSQVLLGSMKPEDVDISWSV